MTRERQQLQRMMVDGGPQWTTTKLAEGIEPL